MSNETTLLALLVITVALIGCGLGYLYGAAHRWDKEKALVPSGPAIRIRRVEAATLLEMPTAADPPLVLAGKLELRSLFEQAFANPVHADPGPVMEWIAENIEDDCLAVFVARRGTAPWSGLSIATDWSNVFSPHPWVVHFFAPKDRTLRIELSRATARWCLERGHTKMVALNRTGHSDARWLASHRHTSEGRVVASYGEFVVRDDL